MKFKNLLGQKFGRWTVIKQAGKDKFKRTMWLCKCECGIEKIVLSQYLLNGDSKSCGCYKSDLTKERNVIIHKKHGDSRSRLYGIWFGMCRRCRDKNQTEYKYYGAKGISVCSKWKNYVNFRDWAISNGYKDNLTIERINVNGNYCPDNCMWIPFEEQSKNRTTCLFYLGKSAKQWSEELGIPIYSLYRYRSYHKCSLGEVVRFYQERKLKS